MRRMMSQGKNPNRVRKNKTARLKAKIRSKQRRRLARMAK
jgi:hypothetical protein